MTIFTNTHFDFIIIFNNNNNKIIIVIYILTKNPADLIFMHRINIKQFDNIQILNALFSNNTDLKSITLQKITKHVKKNITKTCENMPALVLYTKSIFFSYFMIYC